MVAITAPDASVSNNASLTETERWKRLGVATFPGPRGQKGPRQSDWPNLPHAAAWELTKDAAARGPINLVVRTGTTANGTKHLGAIDLDGKCPCEHDRADHQDLRDACWHVPKNDQPACSCERYHGVAPEVALERLLAILPCGIASSRTARGFHLIFWVVRPLPNGTLPAFSADVFGGRDPHALQVAPSLHPSGATYQWVQQPGDDLPTVDLEALGLAPEQPIDAPRAASRSGRSGGRGRPAPVAIQDQFEALMAGLGLRPRTSRGEFHCCPWRPESEGSLHVDWQAAIFHCFGCGEQGGLQRLRELVGASLPPSCNPSSGQGEGIGRGLQLGGSRVRAERDRLADALAVLGDHHRTDLMRGCREATFDAADADIEAFACPSGDATPVKARINSCDDAQCPMCMPWRLGSDWNRHWSKRGHDMPAHLTLVRLHAARLSGGLDDWSYIKCVRAQFREWQRAHGLRGGICGLTLIRDGDCWRAELLVAVGDGDAARLTDGRAFSVELLGHNFDSHDILRAFQHAYLNEATVWQQLDELAAFRALTKGRRKFQGFGNEFGTKATDNETDELDEEVEEMDQENAQPLHRVSGGSGQGSKQPPCCPRCGERLKRVGLFDATRMELRVGLDGITEWRWRAAPMKNAGAVEQIRRARR